MRFPQMDHLIIKYLSKEISLEERHQLSKWLEEDELNSRVLEKYKLYWEMSQKDFSGPRSEVLDRIEQEINREDIRESSVKSSSVFLPNLLKYAAVLALIFAVTFLLNQFETEDQVQPSISYLEKVSPAGQKLSTVLPDGTTVKLNSGSKVIYPSQFMGDKREVILFGEAYFDVKRDEGKPFVIQTADMSVHVLGTSFSVRAFSDGSDQFVAVRSGLVRVVNSSNSDSIQLSKNLMTRLSAKNEFTDAKGFDENTIFGWMDQKLVFSDHTSREVFVAIEKWFGVEIQNQELVKSGKTYTAIFENPTLNEVMGSLSHMYQFNYEIDQKTIAIVR
ncbi:MAG: FecR family protein [Cyclobacteriaceae bacterium]|nr:FecR family protein [Cyclobacteriaceae bacterium SS2]